jgi:hypothetical protein
MVATLPLTDLLPKRPVVMFAVFPFTPFMFPPLALTILTFTVLTIITVAIPVMSHGLWVGNEEGENGESGE